MLRRFLIASACAGAALLTPAVAHADTPEPTILLWPTVEFGPEESDDSARPASEDGPADPISRLLGRLISSFN